MPNTARLPPTPFLPLSRVPRYPVSAGEEQGRGWLNDVRGFAFLVLLCLTLYTPGLTSIPPVDRDKARFAQATTADAGIRRFHPNPLSARSAQQKAYRYSLAAGVPKIPGVARAPSSRNIPSERLDCSTGGGRVTLAIYGLEGR